MKCIQNPTMSSHFYCYSHLDHIFPHLDYCIADFCFHPAPLKSILNTATRLTFFTSFQSFSQSLAIPCKAPLTGCPQLSWPHLPLFCPHFTAATLGSLTVPQAHLTCSPFRISNSALNVLPQISTWFTSLPPSNFASNVSFPLKPSSNILFKIACHPLTFPILLYFSPLDLLSNMPYNLPNLAIVYLFSLECKLHEDRHFCLVCSLIYTPVLRSKPGT